MQIAKVDISYTEGGKAYSFSPNSLDLKVGDVVPVDLKYGDLEIKANVEIVAATDKTAGGKFIDLDLATANKLLYLSILLEEANTPIVDSMQYRNK